MNEFLGFNAALHDLYELSRWIYGPIPVRAAYTFFHENKPCWMPESVFMILETGKP